MLVDGNNVVITGSDGEDIWYELGVQKFTLDGDIVWEKKIKRTMTNQDYKFGIAKNSAGNYLIAASTGKNINGILSFVPAITTVDATTGDSLKTSTLTSVNGNQVELGFCNSIIKDGDKYYASGEVNYNVPNVNNIPTNTGFMTLFAINDNGDFASANPFNNIPPFDDGFGGGSSFAMGHGVFKTNDNHLVLFGKGHFLAPNQSFQQAVGTTYVVKLNTDGLIGIEENESVSGITLYPNPATNNATISYTGTDKYNVTVYNAVGQQVYSAGSVSGNYIINTANFTTGIYYVSIQTANRLQSVMLVKE